MNSERICSSKDEQPFPPKKKKKNSKKQNQRNLTKLPSKKVLFSVSLLWIFPNMYGMKISSISGKKKANPNSFIYFFLCLGWLGQGGTLQSALRFVVCGFQFIKQ